MILDYWWNIGGTYWNIGGTYWNIGGTWWNISNIWLNILVELWVYGGACWCIEIIGWSIYCWIYSRLFCVLIQNILGGGHKNKF